MIQLCIMFFHTLKKSLLGSKLPKIQFNSQEFLQMYFHFLNSFALSYEKKINRGFKSYLKMQLLQVAFWSLHFESSQSAFDKLVLCSHEIKWVIIKFLFCFVLCTQRSVMTSGKRNEGEERVEGGVREVKD